MGNCLASVGVAGVSKHAEAFVKAYGELDKKTMAVAGNARLNVSEILVCIKLTGCTVRNLTSRRYSKHS